MRRYWYAEVRFFLGEMQTGFSLPYHIFSRHECCSEELSQSHAREELVIRQALLFTAVAASCACAGTAHATMRITGDSGGLILDYAQRFLNMRSTGEAVVIDGACLSACTLAVAMLPRHQVCATPNAVLGFHAAWRPTARGGAATSAVATQAMMELYPSDVRSWISRHGGLTPRMIFLRGRELSALVPNCGGTQTVAATTAAHPSTAAGRGSYAAVAGSLPRAKTASRPAQSSRRAPAPGM